MEKENLISDIVSKFDKLGHIPDLFMKGGLAYLGYKSTEVPGNPMAGIGGAITALVGLKLATGNNLAGGAAGVGALSLIGLTNAFKDTTLKQFIETGLPVSGLWGIPDWWGTPRP